MNEIVERILVFMITQILMGFGFYIYIKYRILERQIFLKSCFLFFFGLLFTVEGLLLLFFEVSDGTINILKGFLYTAGFLFGAFLLVILVRMVIRVDDIPPVSDVIPDDDLPGQLLQEIPQQRADHGKFWGWLLLVGGLLLAAACIYVFVAYGPQHDPPGMTVEHQQMDILLSCICGSATLVGLLFFGIGIRKLTRKSKLRL